jgi:urea transport system ATP-binding protein
VTPELMEAGVEALRAANDRAASYGRVLQPGVLDLAHGAILYLEDITVAFDGFKALDALSLAIDAGELRCLIGPNGAGKTTLLDVITGKTRPDAGRAFFGSTSRWRA